MSETSSRWDAFMSVPSEDDDETLDSQWIETFLKILKLITYIITFIIVLSSAVVSRSIVLLMVSMIKVNKTVPVCNEDFESLKNIRDQKYAAIFHFDSEERIAWIWSLLFVLISPEVLTFLRSARICLFKNIKRPKMSTFFIVSQLN